MSVYTPGLLSDKYKVLTKESLEDFIAVGMTEAQIMVAFQKSRFQMDEFCKENYNGLNFITVFTLVRTTAMREFLEAMNQLGVRGNNSAIGIMKEIVLNMKEKDNDVVNVRFVNNIGENNNGDNGNNN